MAQAQQQHKVGCSQDFAIGQMNVFELQGREIGVIRLPGGDLRAINNSCPHKGAPICRGIVGGTWRSSGPGDLTLDSGSVALACPWHGFEYDLATGEEVCWRRPTRLRMYGVEEVDGEVIVTL